MHHGALPCQQPETAGPRCRRRREPRRDGIGEHSISPLCIWVLVSERGLEPPLGYTPHQILSLASLTFPLGADAPP